MTIDVPILRRMISSPLEGQHDYQGDSLFSCIKPARARGYTRSSVWSTDVSQVFRSIVSWEFDSHRMGDDENAG